MTLKTTTNSSATQISVLETMSERAKVTEAKGPAIVLQLTDSITYFIQNSPDKDTLKQLYDSQAVVWQNPMPK